MEKKMAEDSLKYAIVKHAGPSWTHYWQEDPKQGVCQCNSASWTHTGSTAGILPVYEDHAYAESDAEKLNELNPVGDYEVCPLINKGCSICPMDEEVANVES
jgi:hypothetical protein